MRTKVYHMRLTEEEMSLLDKKAIQAGVSKSEYIRRYINGDEIAKPAVKDAKPAKKVIKNVDDVKQAVSGWKPNPKLSKTYQTR